MEKKMQLELTARETLMELTRTHATADYVAMIWAQRYPHTSPAPAKTGWPVKRSK